MLVEQVRRQPVLAATAVILLTSAGRSGDAARSRALGVERSLLKPVRQVHLRDAVLGILAAAGDHVDVQDPLVAFEASVTRRPLRILVADDNAINQMILERLLRKLGHLVTIAVNGQEAIDRVSSEAFDVVLMDVHMPVMDGLASTAAIRAHEQLSKSHVPIIAVTADAIQGDKERFLAAGMDGYISKPIERARLLEAIASAVRGVREASVLASCDDEP